MYTLRIIEETRENEKTPFEQVIINHEIGSCYAIFGPDTARFKSEVSDDMKCAVRAFVTHDNRGQFFIMKNQPNHTFSYFIMTENGKTFERL